ncbi:MAG TPA: DUF669 domain-containing protein [Phycisphaerae bacterium]|nr:DUF669 domain-containing protein [Phycisphaerae bacterium]
MANLGNFNANEVEPGGSFDPLPAGKYLVCLTASQMKPTQRGDASYLELEFVVLEGQHKDRKIWDRLCLDHPNPQTVKIARGSLSSLCRAAGVLQPRDSTELHNIPVVASIGLRKRADTGELTNAVRGYEPKSATPVTAQPAPANSSAPPWKR